jgi:two-component system sensor histidine kinase/response regulator
VRCLDIQEGIAGQAIAKVAPVVLEVSDYPTDRLAPLIQQSGFETLISVPITSKGQVLGALTMGAKRPRAFPPREQALLVAIGQQIGVAVENARLYERAQEELAERRRVEHELRQISEEALEAKAAYARRNRELTLLNRVIAATTSELEPIAVLEAVCKELALAFDDVPTVAAALLDDTGAHLEVVAEYRDESKASPRPSALGAVIPVRGNASTQYVLEHRAPLAVTDVRHDPRVAQVRELLLRRGLSSLLILPLVVRDASGSSSGPESHSEKVIGTIGLDAVSHYEFTEDEIALANSATAAAAQALEKARAEEELRKSEARYRSISELTSDYVYSLTVTPTGALEFDWYTDAFLRITGYTPQALSERGAWASLVHPDDRSYYNEVRQRILTTGQPEVGEYRIIPKGGEVRWLRDYWKPEWDPREQRVVRILGASQDITERKEAARALKASKEAAETANRAKSVFLANMSHELRTPLNAILGFTQLMERDPKVTADQRENLRTIAQSGQHLLMLINDVLEMSKIEAGRTALYEENFDLYRMLEMLEDMFYLRAKEKGLQLLFERAPNVPRYIRADEGKLRQILINLLSNAVKFTSSEHKWRDSVSSLGGEPSPIVQGTGGVVMRIGAFSCDTSSSGLPPLPQGERDASEVSWEPGQLVHLLFEVEDTGPGIPPEDLPYLFDPFVQTASGLESKEGTGLGLPISQQFVKLMHGEITVHSEVGYGSTFRVTVPVELADVSDVAVERPQRRVIGIEPDQHAPDGGPYRILVVEDKALNRQLILKLLEPFGFALREAVNGQEAVEIWQAWKPHLIWMDMRMPVMDGHEATKRIKQMQAAHPLDPPTVIIALTASAFEEDRRLILDEGCDDFVRKPFRENEIFDKLVEHLGIRFVYKSPTLEERTSASLEDVFIASHEDHFGAHDWQHNVVGAPTTAGAPALEAIAAMLALLPSHWRLDLREAAMQADSGVILDLLGRVGTWELERPLERQQLASLRHTLKALVHDFRFDIIIELASMEERE